MSSGENRVWDVIVVGAGPSGAVTAYMLARKGFRTLLVERSSFPRFKVCGGCISARSVERLESLGLGPRIAKLPGVSLSGVKIANGMGSAIELPLPGGLSMTRAMLDKALVDAAVEAGAHFQSGVHARVLDSVSESAVTRSVQLRGFHRRRLKHALSLPQMGWDIPLLHSCPNSSPRSPAVLESELARSCRPRKSITNPERSIWPSAVSDMPVWFGSRTTH